MWYLIVGLCSFAIGLFVRDFFPSYMKEKGKNLATREDIEEITKLQEEVKSDINKKLYDHNRENEFRMNLQYKRYDELYSVVYKNICMSEFYRIFAKETISSNLDFENYPFIDLKNKDIEYFDLLDRINLCNYILNKENLASTQLLKVAVAYKYVFSEMYGKTNIVIKNEATGEEANIDNYLHKQELRLISEMVTIILKEHNELIMELKLDFNFTNANNDDFNIYKLYNENF